MKISRSIAALACVVFAQAAAPAHAGPPAGIALFPVAVPIADPSATSSVTTSGSSTLRVFDASGLEVTSQLGIGSLKLVRSFVSDPSCTLLTQWNTTTQIPRSFKVQCGPLTFNTSARQIEVVLDFGIQMVSFVAELPPIFAAPVSPPNIVDPYALIETPSVVQLRPGYRFQIPVALRQTSPTSATSIQLNTLLGSNQVNFRSNQPWCLVDGKGYVALGRAPGSTPCLVTVSIKPSAWSAGQTLNSATVRVETGDVEGFSAPPHMDTRDIDPATGIARFDVQLHDRFQNVIKWAPLTAQSNDPDCRTNLPILNPMTVSSSGGLKSKAGPCKITLSSKKALNVFGEPLKQDYFAFANGPYGSDPCGKTIDPATLFIIDRNILTFNGNDKSQSGPWSFVGLMSRLAPSGGTESFIRAFLTTWQNAPQPAAVQKVAPRPILAGNIDRVLQLWPKTATGQLDLAKSPFELLAIVFRPDLRVPSSTSTFGQGRLIFGVLDPLITSTTSGVVDNMHGPFIATVIFEYNLPVTTSHGWTRWVQDIWGWSKCLSSRATICAGTTLSPPNLLKQLTDRFTTSSMTGSVPLAQIRTNESTRISNSSSLQLDSLLGARPYDPLNPRRSTSWVLREFKLNSSKILQVVNLAQDPKISDVDSKNATLAQAVLGLSSSALATGNYSLPVSLQAPLSRSESPSFSSLQSFVSIPMNGPPVAASHSGFVRHVNAGLDCRRCHAPTMYSWTRAGLISENRRSRFVINTCQGCHGPETGTSFVQVPAFLAKGTPLSRLFISSFVSRELRHRSWDLQGLLQGMFSCGAPAQ